MLNCKIIGLLGRQDWPTDALEDYCYFLGQALEKHGGFLQRVRVPWTKLGWLRALCWLWKESRQWRGQWVLVQYTALGWSRRGFPLGFAAAVGILRSRDARIAVILHDASPFPGSRIRDTVRRAVQVAVMRWAARRADKLVSPCDHFPWLRDVKSLAKVVHIPVGSMVPQRSEAAYGPNGIPTVVVFGVTENKYEEAALLAQVMRRARGEVGPLRLMVVGRGAPEAEGTLRRSLEGSDVTLSVHGVLPAQQVSNLLAAARVQLFVREGVSARRSSAIAGICCGLPIVGYADTETGFPMTEAGVRLVPLGDAEGLAKELSLVLKDEMLRESLSKRSEEAGRRYFSWDVIAERFLGALSEV